MYVGLLFTGLSILFRLVNGVLIIEVILYFGFFSSFFNVDLFLGNVLYSWVLLFNVCSRCCIGLRLLVIFFKIMIVLLMLLKYFILILLSVVCYVLV